MKYTLLELTQSVLSSMDSDEINSISDSVESQQVVAIIKTVYDDIISRSDLMSNKIPFNLVPSGDAAKPVLMLKPEGIDRIEWLKYDCILLGGPNPVWKDMTYLPVETFVEHIHQYNPSETNVDTFNFSSDGYVFTFIYRNDTAPRYYTSFDDVNIIFDSYDKTVDATLQSAKTLGFGSKKTLWLEADTFVPNLQPQQFALLLNEAKSLAWAELKQVPHQKAEQTARRNWRHLQRTRRTVPDQTFSKEGNFDRIPNFARRTI